MDRVIPSDCDVRVKVEKDALWRRVSHIAWTIEDHPLEDDVYLELNSQPHRPVVIDLISQRMRLLIFPGKFEVMKLHDEEAVVPKSSIAEEAYP